MEWVPGEDPAYGTVRVWTAAGDPVPVTADNLSGFVLLGQALLGGIDPHPDHIPAARPRLSVYVQVRDPQRPSRSYCKTFRADS